MFQPRTIAMTTRNIVIIIQVVILFDIRPSSLYLDRNDSGVRCLSARSDTRLVKASDLTVSDNLGYLLKRISDSDSVWIEIEGANAEISGCTEAVALQIELGTPPSKAIWIEGLYLKASVLCSVA